MLSFISFDDLSPYALKSLLESSQGFYFDRLTGSWVNRSDSDEQPAAATEITANDSMILDAERLTRFSTWAASTLTSEALNLHSFNVPEPMAEITGAQTFSNPGQTDWAAVNTSTNLASDYNIELVFVDNNLTDSQRSIFYDAANRWEEIIVGDVPDVFVSGIGWVDDIVIEISAPFIDGGGGILGQAGPIAVRRNSALPFAGVIELDSADVARLESVGQLDEVVLHEMAHALGFGTVWEELDLLIGASGWNPRYVGEQAVEEYNNTFGLNVNSIPVEDGGGAGTRNSHWEESVFDNELMTGFLNRGEDNPISSITVAAMGDLGYDVNLGAADPYGLANAIAQSPNAIASEPMRVETESNLGPMSNPAFTPQSLA